jgi:hypothetical protein
MSDCVRRYRAIREALNNAYPEEPRGNRARHLNTLAALISGIVGAKHSHLPKLAGEVPDGTKPASRVKRFERWLTNDTITWELYFLPFVEVLLASLAAQTLVLVMDGSGVGRGCVTLMLSVVYRGRALPVAWLVVNGKKGHFPETCHVELVNRVRDRLPAGADVVLGGDGEFDGTDLQATVAEAHWHYVCRTAKNMLVYEAGDAFHLADLPLSPGERLGLPEVQVTQDRYGPVLAIGWWAKDQQEPWYLITNFELVEEACRFYQKRFRIETFFSDQKSRGFRLHPSHLNHPERLSRLLRAACLAYLWIVYLGALAQRDGWQALIHRPDRCDWSLFQLGLSLITFLVNERPDQPIPVQFTVPVPRPTGSKAPFFRQFLG